MMKALKEILPFSAKRQIARLGISFARKTMQMSQRVLSVSAYFGLNFESRLPQKFKEINEFLQISPFTFTSEEITNQQRKPRIAVFFDAVPQPGKDSANVRMTALLLALTRFARVILVTIYRAPSDLPREREFRELGIETIWAIDFEKRFRHEEFDAAILSYPLVADYMFATVKQTMPVAKIIYDTVDIHFVRLEREFEITGDERFVRETQRLKQIEIRLANAADAVWCVTENDKSFLQHFAPAAAIEVVPNIHDLQQRGKEFDERHDLLFIGNYTHRPNSDAIFYFLDEIFPLVLKNLSNVKFYVVGNKPTPEILARATENVIVTDFVADVASYFENSRVFIAPLRYGAGMKGKIGQALSFGLPTVTTAIGAEGMNLIAGRDVLLAEKPDEFAESILAVYHDKRLWQNLSDNGYEFISTNFSPEAVKKKLRSALRQVLPDPKFFES